MVAPVVVAEIVRSGFVEGRHHGSWVAVDAAGTVLDSAGDVDGPMLPRSCNKPLQALGMLEAGLRLEGELLALACASHSGELFHLEGVRRILDSVGLTEDALQTPPDWPLDDDEERERLLRAGGAKSSIQMNCSGKHAAMLATCVVNGWPTESYLDGQHPLQQAIRATFQRMTGETAQVAVDGCGAPLLSTSLTGLARGFSRMATGRSVIADAMRAHPEYVSGTHRDELVLLRAIPGAIGKAGAESCYVVALPDGRAFATKTDDGAARARPVVMAALLERRGVTSEPGVDADAVRRTGEFLLLGGGQPVGSVRAAGLLGNLAASS